MTRRMKRFVTLLAIAIFAAATILSAVDVPYLTGRVVDEANIITLETRARLTTVLKNHEDSTGNQVVVLTVPTIQPESIEDYAVKVFAAWKLGQKGKDNGVLVIVVPQDRKVRIEVGYGLEPTLTDGACGQIIRGVMTPRFKEGDYDRGIEDGVAAIIGRLEGRPDVARAVDTRARSRPAMRFNAPALPWPQRILFGVFAFSIIGLFTVLGVMTPGGEGWFLYVFLIPFWTMFPMAIIGPIPSLVLLAAYVIGYPIAKVMVGRTDWYKKAAVDLKTKGTASVGGFTLSSSGAGFSSGGFSSGGFSGGGGSSGGGGASGSW
ncbi:MAG TPA: TPM domain-containing protein [Vicinamibacterales bacterium]|jgi:uncharacterized protein|nr:TPM domain-containing protein [Vicinamibacterales bacterium]